MVFDIDIGALGTLDALHAAEQFVLLIHLHEVVEAGDGGDGRQLEGPPHDDLDGHEAVARPRDDGRDAHHDGGDVGVGRIQQRQLAAMAPREPQLPQREDNQDGRQYEVDGGVGNQHDAEHDDQEGQHEQRRVDERSVDHLAALQADVEREEHRLKQPGEVHHQARAHLDVVAVDEVAHHHDVDGEDGRADDPGEHRAARRPVAAAPALGQTPLNQGEGDDEGNGEVERHKDADEEHRFAAPLGVVVLLLVLGKGFVLGVGGAAGLAELTGQGGEHGDVVVGAHLEDVVLKHLVALLGKGVELVHLVLHAVVVDALGLKGLKEVLHVVAHAVGILQTGGAILQLLAREIERLVGSVVLVPLHHGRDLHSRNGARILADEGGSQRVDGVEQNAVALAEQILIVLGHRRHAAQRSDEGVVAVELAVEPFDDAVVRQRVAALVAQAPVEIDGLLAGISLVEGVVGRLGVEHQADLLTLVHVGDQLLMLGCALLLVHLQELLLLLVVGGQLGTQDAQRARQVFFFQHGVGRQQRHKHENQNGKEFLHRMRSV